MTVIGLDPKNQKHRDYDFFGKSEPSQQGNDLYAPIRCVCENLARYAGSAWEIYGVPGSTHIYRCDCGIEVQS